MIDLFTIFHKGGAILFTSKLTEIAGQPINHLIKSVLLHERKAESSYNFGEHTMKWTFDNELELVFVAVYLNLTQLLYVDELLESVKMKFIDMFRNDIRVLKPTSAFESFKKVYIEAVGSFESQTFSNKKIRKPRTFQETKKAQDIEDFGSKSSKKKKKKETKPKKKAKATTSKGDKEMEESEEDEEDGEEEVEEEEEEKEEEVEEEEDNDGNEKKAKKEEVKSEPQKNKASSVEVEDVTKQNENENENDGDDDAPPQLVSKDAVAPQTSSTTSTTTNDNSKNTSTSEEDGNLDEEALAKLYGVKLPGQRAASAQSKKIKKPGLNAGDIAKIKANQAKTVKKPSWNTDKLSKEEEDSLDFSSKAGASQEDVNDKRNRYAGDGKFLPVLSNQPKSTKINQNQPKSTKINQNQQFVC